MTKRESSQRTFHDLAEKLDRLNAGATPDDVIDDAFVDALVAWLGPAEPLSDEAMHYAVTKLQAAMKDNALVESIRREHTRLTEEKTLGQVMNEVRTKAEWNLATVAQKLGSDTTFVERLERDLVPLVQVTARQLADLLETFHVRLGEFRHLATRTSLSQQLQRKLGPTYARSKTDASSAQHGLDLAFAIARALPDFDQSSKTPPALDPKLIDAVATELRQRARLDLLTE